MKAVYYQENISKRGKIGQVFEHKPMTDYYNSAING